MSQQDPILDELRGNNLTDEQEEEYSEYIHRLGCIEAHMQILLDMGGEFDTEDPASEKLMDLAKATAAVEEIKERFEVELEYGDDYPKVSEYN